MHTHRALSRIRSAGSQILCQSMLAACVLLPTLPAQNDMGLETGGGSTNWLTRTSTASGSVCLNRWDHDEYRALGYDHDNSGKWLTGLTCFTYDFENPGVEAFAFAAANQGPSPDLPLWASYVVLTAPIPQPAVGTFEARVNFGEPFGLAETGDSFIGCEIAARPPSEATGMWFWCIRSEVVAGTSDLGGPAVDTSTPTSDTYLYGSIDLATTVLFSRRYLMCDPIVHGAAGMATTITNQSTMPSSNTAPGIAGFYSGLHPDVNGFNAGRADTPGYRYADTSMAGQPVLFLISFNGLRTNLLALNSIFPGSTGAYCLNDSMLLGVVSANGSGVAHLNLPLDASARSILGGSGLAAQMTAIGFDGTRLRGAPCANVVY